jgi:hypothetical protein
LNCEVKHLESVDFWAVIEGRKPQHTLENCPKQGKLEKAKLEKKKRVR